MLDCIEQVILLLCRGRRILSRCACLLERLNSCVLHVYGLLEQLDFTLVIITLLLELDCAVVDALEAF